MLIIAGTGADRDHLESNQGLGGTLGRMENWKIHRTPDQRYGGIVHHYLQEITQAYQRT